MATHGIILVGLLIAAYFAPAIIAARRRHAQAGAIFALNLLLGWTFLGWIAALVWSLTYTPLAPVGQARG